uniref:6-bladed beta-propeller n=1 Tax=termite gut metagenome TaxID=433724 RepID=S0DDG4_9ZZZZ
MVSADITAIKDTITMPLSSLVESLEIISLDNRDEALFQYGNVFLSDNHIGISTTNPRSFKLFDRKGKYLRDIGREGRGPGEYLMIYSAAIDEKSETVYILPWNATEMLAFGIDGTIKNSVKLAYKAPKSVFNLNSDGTISFAVVPVGNTPVWAWTQDREGNVVNKIANPKAGQPIDFNSEITAGKNTGEFDPFLLMYGNESNDALSRYNVGAGKTEPIFTVKNIQQKKPPYYSYTQLPNHFIGNYTPGMEQVGEHAFAGLPPVHFIIDKETLQGAYYKLVMDELGDMGAWPSFSQGYFISNMAAIHFKAELEKLLSSGRVADKAMLDKITALDNSLNEEDNNVIILGRLKK